MEDLERREFDMYQRALACLTTEFSDLPEGSAGAQAAQMLHADVAAIGQKSAAQTGFDGTAKQGTAQRSAARRDIREFMTTVARTADVIARRKPGFDEQFPMPYGKNDEQLLAAARAAQAAAIAGSEDFIRLGLSLEYLKSAAAKIEAFADALDMTNQALGGRGAAVGGIDETFENAEEHFETLDAFIRNHYRDQPEKLAAWKIASRVERAPLREKETENP